MAASHKSVDQLPFSLPFRQVHLDFHTGPAIPDVGSQFDPGEFARMVKAAHINSITVFAKCHHGHLYYNTARPERHPGLKPGLDLLAGQVEALHREGIRAPIYLSVHCDEYAADHYPQWIAQNEDGSHVGPKPLQPGWQIMDMASPYLEFLAEQTAEVLKTFKPVDGIFFDMCWDQPSWNPYRLEAMAKNGFNPDSADDNRRYATIVAHGYMKRLHDQVKASSRDASIFFNCRPFFQLKDDIAYQSQAEIEALPTGGWGYMYFPINVRYARTFGKPYLGMTARFHKSWADFGGLKPYAALEYETSQMIAHGARCSVGDQLHPRGILDKASYALIGKVYKRVADREPWLEGAAPVSQIGLFQAPTGNLSTTQSTSRTDEGATRMLTQLRQQFDVVQPTSEFSRYELLILPDAVKVDDALSAKLHAFLAAGGKLLLTGTSGLTPDGTKSLLPELPVLPHGMSPFQANYFRVAPPVLEAASDASLVSYDADHILYDRTVRVTAKPAAETLARIVEPYFDRNWQHFCSHGQTPTDQLSKFAAAVVGKNVAYLAFPAFHSFGEHGNLSYRLLVKAALDRLLPEPLIKVSGPSYIEATVQRQPTTGSQTRTIIHLLGYFAQRRTAGLDIAEDIVLLYDVQVSLKLPVAPREVYLAPSRLPLTFTYNAGRVVLKLPVLRGHEMIVVE